MFAFAILKFCQFKNSFPDDLIEEYKVDKSKVIADFKSFFGHLIQNRYSGSYMHYIMASLVTWLNINDIDVSREELRRKYRIKLPPRGLIMDAPPTREELRRILISSPVNWRSFFSFLSASGVRPSEALVLRIGDLNPHPFDVVENDEIIEVNIPYTITKKEYGYTTFIHPECVSILVDYLKVLEAKGIDVENSDLPLFYNPLSKYGFYKINSAETVWRRVLKSLN